MSEIIKTRINVKFKSPLDWGVVASVLSGLTIDIQIPPQRLFTVLVTEEESAAIFRRLDADDNTERVFYDYTLDLQLISSEHTDPLIDDQWHLSRMKIFEAHAFQPGNDPSVVVAFLDTGLEVTHDEYVGRGISGYGEFWDDPYHPQLPQHGTAVAGCISPASKNGIGIYGPCTNVGLYPIFTTLTFSNLIEGIHAAIGERVDVLNISLGGAGYDADLETAALLSLDSGIVWVQGAGNSNTDAPWYPLIPAGINAGAVAIDGSRANFSNYGSAVSITAPGVNIHTTVLNNTYEGVNGTSFACPLTAAVCALVICENKALTNYQVIDIVKSCVDANLHAGLYKLFFTQANIGDVNALKSVLKARSMRSKYTSTLVPLINFIGYGISHTKTGTNVTMNFDGNFITEVLCYGSKWNQTGVLTLYHGATKIYEGGEQEVPRVIKDFPFVGDDVYTAQSDYSPFALAGSSVVLTNYLDQYGIKLNGTGAAGGSVVTSAQLTVDLTGINALGFRLDGMIQRDFEYYNTFRVKINGVTVQTIQPDMTNNANFRLYEWLQIVVDVSKINGSAVVLFEHTIVESYNINDLRIAEVFLSAENAGVATDISLISITEDLLLVAECQGTNAAYQIPLNGIPRLLHTVAEQTGSTVTLESWDGATVYYKIDGEPDYSTYSAPLSVSAPLSLTYYSQDATFTELPKTLVIPSSKIKDIIGNIINLKSTNNQPVTLRRLENGHWT